MNQQKKIAINDLAKIQWACRRGMLELDVLLGNFFKDVYSSLNVSDQELFVELLDQPDPMLFSWLLGREIPEDKRFAHITEMIQRHAKSRIQT